MLCVQLRHLKILLVFLYKICCFVWERTLNRITVHIFASVKFVESIGTHIQGAPVLNVNNSPVHSQLKNKLTCIMSFSWKMLSKDQVSGKKTKLLAERLTKMVWMYINWHLQSCYIQNNDCQLYRKPPAGDGGLRRRRKENTVLQVSV